MDKIFPLKCHNFNTAKCKLFHLSVCRPRKYFGIEPYWQKGLLQLPQLMKTSVEYHQKPTGAISLPICSATKLLLHIQSSGINDRQTFLEHLCYSRLGINILYSSST